MYRTRCCALSGWVSVCVFLGAATPSLGEEKPKSSPAQKAAALVLQALENEVAGDAAARDRLLKQAADVDPNHAPAHWHLGQVRQGDDWLPVREAMIERGDSPADAEYKVLRAEADGNPTLELKLARWCLKNQMPDRARLHFWRVLSNAKADRDQMEDAARQLELVAVGGRILTRGQLKKEQEREQAIASAIEKYCPLLADLQAHIDGSSPEKRAAAAARLAALDDPSLIPAIETYVTSHRERFGEELLKVLVRFPQVEATQTILRYAVLTPYLTVRESAIAELKKRPWHDYMPTLLAGLVSPLEAKYQFQRDRRGNIRYQRVFVQERADATLVQSLEQLYRPQVARINGNGTGSGTRAAAIINSTNNYLIESDIATEIARVEFVTTASQVAARQNNRRIVDVLTQVTGQQLPASPQEWWQWWQEYNQVHYPKPTYQLYSYTVQPYISRAVGVSCFLKGTVVWTEQGLRPIESIQPGDRVLSQHPNTGELTFKLVTATTLRPPSEASNLKVLGESITTTLGHPLWVTGQGWEMAKNLKSGDQLHGVHGILVVSTIDPLPHKIEAHNLVVEDFGTYFVGNCGVLVHDNTYRQPTRAVVPGLVP